MKRSPSPIPSHLKSPLPDSRNQRTIEDKSSSSFIKRAVKSLSGLFRAIFRHKKKIDEHGTPQLQHSNTTRSNLPRERESPYPLKNSPAFQSMNSSRSRSSYYGTSTSTEIDSKQPESYDNLTFQEIYWATGNFSQANKIGEGGFGTVYKARLSNGSIVAVKRAKRDYYDQRLAAEFQNEILTLTKIEHLSLVRFYAFVVHEDERLIVVEYVSNGNLGEHLDGIRGSGLEIEERLEIAIDVAHAITYLHSYTDPPIIHRDIKASNILITENLRAKVADFGFARLGSENNDATHISTEVKGTAGYLDPEYLKTYQLTDKSDVYSFGVLLVELVTGRHPIEFQRNRRDRFTTKWALRKLREGEVVVAMDQRLRRNFASIQAVEKVLKLARQCVASSRFLRPSMEKCAKILWEIRRELNERSNANFGAVNKFQSDNILVEKRTRKSEDLYEVDQPEDSYIAMFAHST